ncbi:2-amino-4-hydroxy-6-hydroxymethyldihydropteridine diphosphokinase [Idiomarina sp. OT37-5b]|jgi:2-amino-4-hydroxy-6-hydroxymethyldihydropteridine diphosphokinase|uniref:2-amino-4-hydroxy-6-hydroxymethyldihydropteridine pyrophosphokinase n=1 Tax=Idiomarina aquatica TaxID=1327752 RepID=A0AA94EE78_9GAMM|nr:MULTISPECIES: 2-amino-4-hydroxy-6-hydroxymethyldihydropteridine diphosphokinase [Idiomarina]AVJ56195.1 2-amino-4-hydroxy-6-hydroxymethyldihydropteridine diphosphokinase [Idiomarina sp. OT37-5b]RUO43287.1 2-amino-4-hydroxy-6-hydroxymethyldihydropteridine diphosphokinase [Idiomarina aquatica]
MKYLCSLGSNIEPELHFSRAKHYLAKLSENLEFSRDINTQPVGMKTNRPFLNALFTLDTALSAEALKQEFNRIEELLGRDRSDPLCSIKDRPIDIDILGPLHENPEVPEYLQPLQTDLQGETQ